MKVEKKSFVFGAGAVLLLIIGFVFGRMDNRGPKSVQLTPIPVPISTSAPSPVPETFKVIRVIDGDTIEIEGGERIRYLGIDTPETVDPRKPVQCFGIEAAKKNKELVEGKTVRLEKDVTDKDKYSRL